MVTTRENPLVITQKKYAEEVKSYRHQKALKYKNKQQGKKKETTDLQNNQKTMNKMATVSPYLSTNTLNVNGLNFPIKRHRMAECGKNMIQKHVVLTRVTLILKAQ